jgi:hypothetical protein
MPFGLKSDGAMYERGIQNCLCSQLGRNVEAYIDDVVVKTWEDEGLIFDLAETFKNLRKFSMKLNPEECTFSVPSWKLLGYVISQHGIDPNLEKVSATTSIMPPESHHDIQKLIGCMSALRWFISRLGVGRPPFFKLHKK